MSDMYPKPHNDDEGWDAVKVWQEPRWKESELSGDEWRFRWVGAAYRKGEVVKEFVGRTVVDVMTSIAAASTDTFVPIDSTVCMQPTCAMPGTEFGRLKKEYARTGEELKNQRGNRYRVFCLDHKHRGDCALEDADLNYEWLDSLEEA